VGVFDTVSAIGAPYEVAAVQPPVIGPLGFGNTNVGVHIQHAYHALALDEQRQNFRPVMWHKTMSPPGVKDTQVLEQVWFGGGHSDIGGGWLVHDLADITLVWMVAKTKHMLEYDLDYIKVSQDGTLRALD